MNQSFARVLCHRSVHFSVQPQNATEGRGKFRLLRHTFLSVAHSTWTGPFQNISLTGSFASTGIDRALPLWLSGRKTFTMSETIRPELYGYQSHSCSSARIETYAVWFLLSINILKLLWSCVQEFTVPAPSSKVPRMSFLIKIKYHFFLIFTAALFWGHFLFFRTYYAHHRYLLFRAILHRRHHRNILHHCQRL